MKYNIKMNIKRVIALQLATSVVVVNSAGTMTSAELVPATDEVPAVVSEVSEEVEEEVQEEVVEQQEETE